MELQINQNDIHNAIYDWLFNALDDKGTALISELSIIGASYDEDGNIKSDSRIVYTPQTMGKSTTLKQYTRGAARMQYDFSIRQYAPISDQSNTKANLKITKVFEDLVLWIKTQYDLKNLPVMPSGCKIEKITVNPGVVAGVDKNGAEFMMIISIIYTKGAKI